MSEIENCTHDCSTCGESCSERQEPQSLLKELNPAARVGKVYGVVSGKGGTGKTSFTAGVGENDKVARKTICEYLGFMGVAIDDEANNIRGEERVISTADSKVKVMLIPTNEELAIARETKALV